MEKLRKNKGITLIALVITIIVLLILAGVTIATLTGENGILTQANKAKTETEKAGEDEKFKLAIMGSYGLDGKLNLADLKRNLTEQGISYTDSSSFPLTATVNGESIEIKEDGKQEKLFNAAEWDKTATSEDCFIWGSDIEGEEGYDVVVGYTQKIENNTKLKFPSRCTKIDLLTSSYTNASNDSSRSFCSAIKAVELPNTVTEVGNHAFASSDGYFVGFDGLESIIIPDSVTSIGWQAFFACDSISNITIPSSVTTMEDSAFSHWTSSQTINIQGYSSAPSEWNSGWQLGCSATINWNQ